jgi:hypothetical protein
LFNNAVVRGPAVIPLKAKGTKKREHCFSQVTLSRRNSLVKNLLLWFGGIYKIPLSYEKIFWLDLDVGLVGRLRRFQRPGGARPFLF